VKVLKGAVNINGANFGAVPRHGEEKKSWRVYVPSTHPITKVRGLDRVNHVQFLSCDEPVGLQGISPDFTGIWATKKELGRSFDFVSQYIIPLFVNKQLMVISDTRDGCRPSQAPSSPGKCSGRLAALY
jgi:hypothetical protein